MGQIDLFKNYLYLIGILIKYFYGFLFIAFRIIWVTGWLVGFYGLSILVGYLMPNPLYTYIIEIIYRVTN